MASNRAGWEVILHGEVDAWFLALAEQDEETALLVEQAIDALAAAGPTLGRPLVDRVTGSRLHNLKELRPGSAGSSEIRMLFIFDAQRRALFLVAGDKAGQWTQWYGTAINLAEQRYAQLVHELSKEDAQ